MPQPLPTVPLSSDESNNHTDDESDYDDSDICQDIASAISCLTELGPALEENVSLARRPQEPVYPMAAPFSVSDPTRFYVQCVQEKFRNAPLQLVERLAEANWQRHVKIRHQMESAAQADSTWLDELSAARSVLRPYSEFHDSGLGTSHYAPSHSSFISSDSGNTERSIGVPPTPPEVAAGKPFQCYICGNVLSTVRNRIDWK